MSGDTYQVDIGVIEGKESYFPKVSFKPGPNSKPGAYGGATPAFPTKARALEELRDILNNNFSANDQIEFRGQRFNTVKSAIDSIKKTLVKQRSSDLHEFNQAISRVQEENRTNEVTRPVTDDQIKHLQGKIEQTEKDIRELSAVRT